MTKLLCVSGMNQGDEWPLKEGVNIIGRAADSDIRLFDRQISRHHCQVLRRGDYYMVDDLSSRHGTHVGSKPVKKRTRLTVDDRLIVGKTVLRLTGLDTGNAHGDSPEETAEGLQEQAIGRLLHEAAADAGKNKRSGGGRFLGIFRKGRR